MSDSALSIAREVEPAAVAAEAGLLARAWSPPGSLPAAVFAALSGDAELLELAAEIPGDRLPPLLFAAASSRLVAERAPEPLRRSYPVPGGSQPPLHPRFATDFREFCLEHSDALRELFATRRYQSADVAWCAQIAPALAAAAGGRDVALVDLGGGAGFALHLDRYRYIYRDTGGRERIVGDPSASVTVETAVPDNGWPPLPAAAPRIVARLGLEAEPAALDDADVRDWLAACVPPEASAATRLERTLDLALADPVTTVRADPVDALAELIAGLPHDALVCVLDSHVHLLYSSARLARIAAVVAAAGRERDLDWLSLHPLVGLGPHARRSVIGIEVPAAFIERSGTCGVLARLSFRDGRARPSLLALAHPGGAWLHWLGDDS